MDRKNDPQKKYDSTSAMFMLGWASLKNPAWINSKTFKHIMTILMIIAIIFFIFISHFLAYRLHNFATIRKWVRDTVIWTHGLMALIDISRCAVDGLILLNCYCNAVRACLKNRVCQVFSVNSFSFWVENGITPAFLTNESDFWHCHNRPLLWQYHSQNILLLLFLYDTYLRPKWKQLL